MTVSLSWQEVHKDLKALHDDLNREQGKLYTRAMALQNKCHELQELIDLVVEEISKQEASDDAKDYS